MCLNFYEKRGSVDCDFEKALSIIQQVDELTLHAPKIFTW